MVPQAILRPELPLFKLAAVLPVPSSSKPSWMTIERPTIESTPNRLNLLDWMLTKIRPATGRMLPKSPAWAFALFGEPWFWLVGFQCGPADSHITDGSWLISEIPNVWMWRPRGRFANDSVCGMNVKFNVTWTGLTADFWINNFCFNDLLLLVSLIWSSVSQAILGRRN